MVRSENSNSNPQLDTLRGTYNNKISKLSILGGTKRLEWESKRRHRSI